MWIGGFTSTAGVKSEWWRWLVVVVVVGSGVVVVGGGDGGAREAVKGKHDVIKWKHFSLYWPFVRGTHRPLVNSPHKGQ